MLPLSPRHCPHLFPAVFSSHCSSLNLWPLRENEHHLLAGLPSPSHSTQPHTWRAVTAMLLKQCLNHASFLSRCLTRSSKASTIRLGLILGPLHSGSPQLACPVVPLLRLCFRPPPHIHQSPSQSRGPLLQAQVSPRSSLPFLKSLDHILDGGYQIPERPASAT